MKDNPEEVKSMGVRGASVMVGLHADGDEELIVFEAKPVNPRTASDWDWGWV